MSGNIRPIEPISKDPMHEKVSDAVTSYIFRNHLTTGDKLPSERQLSEVLKVGRNSVRQALSLLENEGIIERVAGKGAFIRHEVSPDFLNLKLMEVDYRDLLEIKTAVEQLAVRRAVESATEEQAKKLKSLAAEMMRMADNDIFSIQKDREFHTVLLDCGGSHTLKQMVLALIDSLNSYTGMLKQAHATWLKTIPFHMDLAKAIEQRQLSFALAAHEYIFRYDIMVLDEQKKDPEEGQQS